MSVQVEIFSCVWDEDGEGFREIVHTTLIDEGNRFSYRGDSNWGGFEGTVVVDAESGRPLTLEEDGEGWARQLPSAFRDQFGARVRHG